MTGNRDSRTPQVIVAESSVPRSALLTFLAVLMEEAGFDVQAVPIPEDDGFDESLVDVLSVRLPPDANRGQTRGSCFVIEAVAAEDYWAPR